VLYFLRKLIELIFFRESEIRQDGNYLLGKMGIGEMEDTILGCFKNVSDFCFN
jgi:hypothetical protein